MKKIIGLILLAVLISSCSALGTLHTAKVGKQVNLTESNKVDFTLKVSNNLDQEIDVVFTPSNFTNLLDNRDYRLIEEYTKNYTLKPMESREFGFSLTIDSSGEYEGTISVTFRKPESKQYTTLNSIIQLNAFGEVEKEKHKRDYIFYLLSFILVIVIIISAMYFRKKRN
jgi:PBP1b-binding outer membrane lipoprotein LpoB